MQITLIQSELEQAIREFVGRQMKIADGMEMKIELAATRGTDGFKAVIDIIPGVQRPVSLMTFTQPAAPVQNRSVFPAVLTPANVVAKAAEETIKFNEPIEVTTSEAPLSEDAASVEPEATEGAAPVALHAEQTPTAPTVPASNSRSLFGGLKKPKNN